VRLARRIVADGLVVPSMDWDDGDQLWYAAWQPMPSLRLAGLRAQLVAAMPPAMRCWMFDDEVTLTPAGEVFDGALNSLVDMVANKALAGEAGMLLPPRRAAGRADSGG
jgi:hypothetical protein